jgi:hypothetical protein
MNSQLKSEATVIKRGLHWRCVTSAEAAAWADAWIAKLDDPPSPLLDLSLSGRAYEADAAGLLEPLSRSVADTELVPETLGLLAQVLRRHPERLDLVCAALWDLSFEQVLPAEVNEEASSARWRLQEARLGVYDSVEEVAADVTRALQPYFERF